MKSSLLTLVFPLFLGSVCAQTTLFNFDTASSHSPLPISLSAEGITAQFSATGQGFSIQPADTMGFTPVGFSGNCIYPSSVLAAGLRISFSQSLSDLSILYAPQELACDSSARMRITAYMDSTEVATATTTADPPGTWPSATLAVSAPEGFNNVVIHYDAPPPTGGDWGPIFMADNLSVIGIPEPAGLTLFALGFGTAIFLRWHSRQGRVNTSAGVESAIPPRACGSPYRVREARIKRRRP